MSFKLYCRYSVCLCLSLLHTQRQSVGNIEWTSFYWVCPLTVSLWLSGINQSILLHLQSEAGETLSPSTEWHYALWTDQLRKGRQNRMGMRHRSRKKSEMRGDGDAGRLCIKSDWWCWTKTGWEKNDLNGWKKKATHRANSERSMQMNGVSFGSALERRVDLCSDISSVQ